MGVFCFPEKLFKNRVAMANFFLDSKINNLYTILS